MPFPNNNNTISSIEEIGGRGNRTRRRTRADIAKLSAHYERRNRIPKIDIEENPFCQERQLADAAEQIKNNRNPTLDQSTPAETLRSTSFLQSKNKFENDLEIFKSRIIAQSLKDADDRSNNTMDDGNDNETMTMRQTLQAPIIREPGYMFGMSDSGVTMSFGHKQKEASRTFNPIPMRADSILQPHKESHKKAGFMTTTMLYNLLHPSSISSSSSTSAAAASSMSSSSSGATTTFIKTAGADGVQEDPPLATLEASSTATTNTSNRGAVNITTAASSSPPLSIINGFIKGPILTLTPEKLHDEDIHDDKNNSSNNRGGAEPSIEEIREAQWNNDYRSTSQYFSSVPSLLSEGNHTSVEKLTRFQKKASGAAVPELFKDRFDRDMEYLRETCGTTYFPKANPVTAEERVVLLTPRTRECNQQIKQILARQKQHQEMLDEKILKHKLLEKYERIPKLQGLQI